MVNFRPCSWVGRWHNERSKRENRKGALYPKLYFAAGIILALFVWGDGLFRELSIRSFIILLLLVPISFLLIMYGTELLLN